MNPPYAFDQQYHETVVLPGGERIELRLVRPDDKQRLLDTFSQLSAPSRYKRFFAAKHRLSDAELAYFTETDGTDHFALVAVETRAGSEGACVGVARGIRLAADPECAEVAITVIDRMQGHGVGRQLLERLIRAAQERGILRFRFECLAHNREVQRLVQRVCRVVDTRYDEDVLIAEADLPRQSTDACAHSREAYFGLLELLRALAIQTMDIQLELGHAAMQRSLDAALGGVEGLSFAEESERDVEAEMPPE
jgi:acetyltransferase